MVRFSTIEKTYEALVWGKVKHNKGVIDKPIGKSSKDFRQWSAQPGARGNKRDAVTEFKVIERASDVVYMELKPTNFNVDMSGETTAWS